MAKRKCRGGACALKNLARPKAATPPPQPIFPQAAQQVPPSYANATAGMQPRPYQAVNPSPMSQIGQGIPQSYNPQASLAQQMAPLGQSQQNMAAPVAQQMQNGIQGPLQGLAQGQGWYSPYAQQGMPPSFANATAGMQQMQQQNPNIPVPNTQNTAIPQGQVLHPSGKQRKGIGKFFAGSRPQVFNNPLYNQYQNDVLNYLTQFGLQGLEYQDQNEPGNQFDFSPIGNQELERFYTQTIPSIAERFTSMGGGQRSSAFQGALGQAGRSLGNDLAAQQQGYNLQQQQLAQNQFGMNQNLYTNLLNMGLRPQFESNLQPGRGGAGPGLLKAGATAAMALI
jgi:hypothetical protein